MVMSHRIVVHRLQYRLNKERNEGFLSSLEGFQVWLQANKDLLNSSNEFHPCGIYTTSRKFKISRFQDVRKDFFVSLTPSSRLWCYFYLCLLYSGYILRDKSFAIRPFFTGKSFF